MKDYEQQVNDFRKENFDLKLRVHLLEERLKLTFDGKGYPGLDVHKQIIDLKVKIDYYAVSNYKIPSPIPMFIG
jgi:hypothetical protein